MEMTQKELEKLEKFKVLTSNNGGTLYRNNNDIIKIQNLNQPYEHREEVIDQLLHKEKIANSSYPIEKIYIDGEYAGYTMPDIKDTTEFNRVINRNELTTYDRLEIIKNLTNTFKEFHNKEIIFGDIHLGNYLFDSQNNGYIIDLDDVIVDGNYHDISQLYYINERLGKAYDNKKFLITASSFIFNLPIEKIVMYRSYETAANLLLNSIENKELLNYYRETLTTSNNPIYFDEVISELDEPEKVKKIKDKLQNNFGFPR